MVQTAISPADSKGLGCGEKTTLSRGYISGRFRREGVAHPSRRVQKGQTASKRIQRGVSDGLPGLERAEGSAIRLRLDGTVVQSGTW